MKKTIFISTFLLCLFTIHPSKAQLTYGYQKLTGTVVRHVVYQDVFALPVSRELATFTYTLKDTWFIKADVGPANLQSYVNHGKPDHTIFDQFGISIGGIYTFMNKSDIPMYAPRLTLNVGFVYKNILEDTFAEPYSLNLQKGRRGGILVDFGLLVYVNEYTNCKFGVSQQPDFWLWNTKDAPDQLSLGYEAFYFELNVDLIKSYKLLKEKYRRKK